MTETWKTIPGYEGHYEVSDLGRVRSIDRLEKFRGTLRKRYGRILKQRIIRDYPVVNPKKYDKGKTALVHRLVAIAFVPNPNNYPVINHKDFNPVNNLPENLEWVTQKQNIHASVAAKRHCHGETHGCSKINESDVLFIRGSGFKTRTLMGIFKMSKHNINNIKNRKSWKHVA